MSKGYHGPVILGAVAALTLWLLASVAAQAEDPRDAARALGAAGQASAGAIARNPASAHKVPGHVGANVPERGHSAAGMEDAARAVLADPDAPGGRAGRMVIEGTVSRPPAEVQVDDPAVTRAESIADTPQEPEHGASGIASGSIADCQAGIGEAGGCGSVTSCVGAGCETVAGRANTGFARSTAMLNMVLQMGGEEFDRQHMRFFQGQRRACTIRWGGLANCCKNSGLLIGFANCSQSEIDLAKERQAGTTRYLGKYCAKRTFFGFCRRRARAWCVFGSKLGRILQEQGRAQLGIGWGSCRGLTVAEIERIDFNRLDLGEFTANLTDDTLAPLLRLPEAGNTRTRMNTRIRDFYSRSQP